jgi:dsRNA-specific ribonuclease
MKDAFVSNSRLAKASLDFGLDRYIITKAPTQEKWKPMYVEDHLHVSASTEGRRRMSTKTLADVVEALVGVSYLDGGLPKALECIALFMPPKGKWRSIAAAREALYDAAPSSEVALPPTMEPLEELIGYSFRKKALLVEAMTHSSYRVPGTHACLERLEFFGDSILEYLVVRRLFAVARPEPLAHWQMHLLKTALVNKDFLAFRVMEWSVAVAQKDVTGTAAEDPGSSGGGGVAVEAAAPARLPLWSFMRYSSGDLALAQRATGRRHAALREGIERAMSAGDRYPWAQLARLQAQKYYSDVFESLLGAVYVDSGSFEECDAILERAGILPYLERMVRDGVKVWHPKEELGRLAVSEKVEYVIEVKESEEDDGVREFTCRVLVGERVVADVGGGVSREEVRTRAAEEAIRYYDGLGKM